MGDLIQLHKIIIEQNKMVLHCTLSIRPLHRLLTPILCYVIKFIAHFSPSPLIKSLSWPAIRVNIRHLFNVKFPFMNITFFLQDLIANSPHKSNKTRAKKRKPSGPVLTNPSAPFTSIAVLSRCVSCSMSDSYRPFSVSSRLEYTSVAPGSASGGLRSCRGGEKLGRISTSQSM